MWDLSCVDWQDRIREGRSIIPDLSLFREPADRAVAFFNRLRLPDVAGDPMLDEAAGEWFREIVAALFGSIDPVSGERYIRELFCLVPKKNSKTTNAAGLMLTALVQNERPRAEFMLVGPTQDISGRAFSQAVGMIEADDRQQRRLNGRKGFLATRLHVRDHIKEIEDRATKAKLKIKTFDEDILTGTIPAGTLLDEVHLLGKHARAGRIIGQLRGGMAPIAEAFLAQITTQSDEPPAGVFRAELDTARAVRDGRLQNRMLAVLYEFPEDVANDRSVPPKWQDPTNWAMVNPNRGRSITVPRLVEDFETAKTKGEAEIRRWASQHLNIEIGLALLANAWVGSKFWTAAADPSITPGTIIERCDVVVAGIDGGGLDDLLGLGIIGRERVTRNWLHWGKAWCHRSVLEVRKSEAPKLLDLEKSGDLSIVDDLGPDIEALVGIVKRFDDAGLLHSVGLDPAGVGAIVDALAEVGIEGEGRVVGVSQGWRLSGAIKSVERKLVDGSFRHAGQPVMAYAVGNAKVEPRGNAILITKQASGTAKIDPLMAAFDAAALMATNPEPVRRGSYLDAPGAELIVL